MEGVLDKDQRLGEGRVEAEDEKLDYEDSSDDEEVKLLLPRKGADERDPPGAYIRDVPEASGTEREDWFHTEPLHGARPKWNLAGRPQVVSEEPKVLEAEATGGVVGPGHRGAQSSGSTVATGSAEHAGYGSGNATKEGG